jgi:uncharacterized protein (TIGR04141 family)
METDVPAKTQVTLFLAKENINDSGELYRQNPSFRTEVLMDGDKSVGWLVSKIAHPATPKWINFFAGFTDLRKLGENKSTGALFIVKHNDRFFVFSFGTAYHQIKFENIERDFGLKTTLNCIDENSIRCIDKSSLEAQPKESREQSGAVTDIRFFGIDVERDLLKAVVGTPKKKFSILGTRITGRDQVKFGAFIKPSNVASYLSTIYNIYKSDNYKTGPFSWVDHICEVKDITLVNQLNDDLITRLVNKDFETIWVTVPEIVDWEDTYGFKYISPARYTKYDVNILELLDNIDGEISVDVLKSRKIFSVDANHEVLRSWQAFRFIYAESRLDGLTYLLNNGKWYQINVEYSQLIDNFYLKIKRYNEQLPIFDDATETKYNARVAKEHGEEFYLFDCQNIKTSTMASAVEPCDLFRYPDQFIHVKRYGGSSVLSHLFNQGLVSGELFKREPEFKEKLTKAFGEKVKVTKIDDHEHRFKIVYAIISEYEEDLSIPFFSKISLKHSVTRLEALGYQVYLAKISVEEVKKKLKKYKRKSRR